MLRPRKVRSQARKLPFDIASVMRLLRSATSSYTPAAMFQLAEEGFNSPFEILIACIISIRTLDETTILCAHADGAEAVRDGAIASANGGAWKKAD